MLHELSDTELDRRILRIVEKRLRAHRHDNWLNATEIRGASQNEQVAFFAIVQERCWATGPWREQAADALAAIKSGRMARETRDT